jgi:hypothetical protein
MRAWTAVSAAVQALSFLPPPTLDGSVWSDLEQHGLARRRVPGAVETVMGVEVWPCSREAAWLGITDDHPPHPVTGLTEIRLSGAGGGPKVLYQYLDLPWPLQDRHWAIALQNNLPLAKTGVWERHWSLDAEAMTQAKSRMDARYDDALMTPVNEGAWLLVPVSPAETLVVYQSRASLGGSVPDGAVEDWAMSSLSDAMHTYQTDALRLQGSYLGGCTPQIGGDNALIPCFATP